jgi:hypothetical protein
VNRIDPSGLVNWITVGRGTFTTVGGVASIYGGAAIAGVTGVSVAGAAFGGATMFAGGIAVGLGITTIADGFHDSSGSPADIPQGPGALAGQMTGNVTAEDVGGMVDLVTGFLMPPKWGGPAGLVNTLLFSPRPPSPPLAPPHRLSPRCLIRVLLRRIRLRMVKDTIQMEHRFLEAPINLGPGRGLTESISPRLLLRVLQSIIGVVSECWFRPNATSSNERRRRLRRPKIDKLHKKR